MNVSETDLELIEAALDGDADATTALAGRTAADPALADAMADAAVARENRKIFWQSLTPTQVKADQFAWQVRGAVAGQNTAKRPAAWWMPGGIVRYGSVAAACIVFGFYAGRSANRSPTPEGTPAATPAQSVLVPISDEYGRPVFQQFKSKEDATKFETQLHQSLQPTAPVNTPLQTASETKVDL